MNKIEITVAIASDTGLPKVTVMAALSAIAQQLQAEGLAGRAVVFDDFGTFFPRKKMGKRTGHALGGGTITYPNWKLIVDPEVLEEAGFTIAAAERAELKAVLFNLILQSYKAHILDVLRKGGSFSYQGYGSFTVSKRKARVFRRDDGSVSSRTPAKKVIVYSAGKFGAHQKFLGLPGLV